MTVLILLTLDVFRLHTGKERVPTFILGDTADTSSTESTVSQKQGLESLLHSLDTVKAALNIEKVLLWNHYIT